MNTPSKPRKSTSRTSTDCRGWTMSADALEELQHMDASALRARVQQLEADLAEADRRAGEAERKFAGEEDSYRKLRQWISRAKAEAGYHDNISFDVVWDETLAAAQAHKASIATAQSANDGAGPSK